MNKIKIDSSVIRAVWSSVEAINKTALVQLNDTDLTYQIMRQVENTSVITLEDRQSLSDYISSKVLLIRDIASS